MKSTEAKIELNTNLEVSQDRIQKFLEDYHNLGTVKEFSVFEEGFANEVVYLKTDEDEYILKIAIRNNPDRVRYEVELLNFLKDLPAPEPTKNKTGKYLGDYDGHKTFIYKFLPGQQKQTFTPSMLEQIGEFTGRFHQQSIKFETDIERIEYYNLTPEIIKEMVSKGRALEKSEIQDALSYLKIQATKYLLSPVLPKGAVHLDIKPENVLFEEERLTGVVDFDNSYIGPLVLDLAKAMTWFCTENKRFDLDKARKIYNGYIKNRELSDPEKDGLAGAIHYSYITHPLIDIDWLARGFLPDADYILWQLENMLPAEKNLEISIEDFE